MVVRRLQPGIARHLIGIPFTYFTSLTSSRFYVKYGIAKGMWSNSFPIDPKGKKPSSRRNSDVHTIPSSTYRITKYRQIAPQTIGIY